MPQKTFAGGLALQKNMKNTLLPAALCLLSACDNDAVANNAASDNPALAASSGRTVGEVFRDALLISGGKARRWWCCPPGASQGPAASLGGLARVRFAFLGRLCDD